MKRVIFLLLLMISPSIIQAQSKKVTKPEWRKIGETSIDFKKDSGEILVTDTRLFGAVKIKVIDAPVNLEAFDVYFESGEMQSIEIHQLIKSNSETNAVNVSGKKAIKKVDFRYKSIGASSNVKPLVELWAF